MYHVQVVIYIFTLFKYQSMQIHAKMYIFLTGNLPRYAASPGSHREKNTLEELEVHIMAKEVYKKVLPLYFKANAKLSPPVIMTEAVFAQKLVRVWNDVNTILCK